MTNEVAAASTVSGALCSQLDEGKEVAAQVTAWVTEKGLDFAVNLLVAAVILVVGWLVIKLVDAVVRKALMRGKAKQTLFVNFACSVVTKASDSASRGSSSASRSRSRSATSPRE